jgi:hypothetical protein
MEATSSGKLQASSAKRAMRQALVLQAYNLQLLIIVYTQ